LLVLREHKSFDGWLFGSEPGTAEVLLAFADPVVFPQVFPYGLEVVRNSLTNRGLQVAVSLPFLTRTPAESLRLAIARLRPKLVGLSFRNLDEAGFDYESEGDETFIGQLVELTQVVKHAGVPAALGGAGYSIAPVQLLAETGADVGFVGTSEAEFAEFCVRVVRGGLPVAEACLGLSSVVRPNRPAPPPPRARLGLPYEFNASHRQLATLTGGHVGVRTKSGCTLRCSYCVVPWIEELNLRPWDDIRTELQQVVSAGLGKRIFIADGEFNLPSDQYAIDLCRKIKSEFEGQLAWRCYIDAGHVSDELITSMIAAGCVGVSITADSYSRLGRVGHAKASSVAAALDATDKLIGSGISTTINILFGGPKETIESALETAGHCRRFHEHGAYLALTIGQRVYPNTPLERIARNPRFAKHHYALKRYPWLGVFCSPVPREKLVEYIEPILPKGNRIAYTNTLPGADKDFFREVAIGAMLLAAKNYLDAHRHFDELYRANPERKEALLGLLEAEAGLRGMVPRLGEPEITIRSEAHAQIRSKAHAQTDGHIPIIKSGD